MDVAVANCHKSRVEHYFVSTSSTRCVTMQVDIAIPEVFIGGLLGAMLVFLFSAWACAAVGRSAQAVVNEVQSAGSQSHPLHF